MLVLKKLLYTVINNSSKASCTFPSQGKKFFTCRKFYYTTKIPKSLKITYQKIKQFYSTNFYEIIQNVFEMNLYWLFVEFDVFGKVFCFYRSGKLANFTNFLSFGDVCAEKLVFTCKNVINIKFQTKIVKINLYHVDNS